MLFFFIEDTIKAGSRNEVLFSTRDKHVFSYICYDTPAESRVLTDDLPLLFVINRTVTQEKKTFSK